MLLAAYRRLEAAAVPLIPIALATGWSSLLLFVLQIPLNPMSATLGALVIAISTEFAVILSARYRAERAARAGAGGRAVAHLRAHGRGGARLGRRPRSPGFAALLVSDFPMLRDFGAVTVVNLAVSLLGRDDRAAGGARVGRAARPAARAALARRGGGARARPRGRALRAGAARGRAVRGPRHAGAALRRTAGRRARAVVPSRK